LVVEAQRRQDIGEKLLCHASIADVGRRHGGGSDELRVRVWADGAYAGDLVDITTVRLMARRLARQPRELVPVVVMVLAKQQQPRSLPAEQTLPRLLPPERPLLALPPGKLPLPALLPAKLDGPNPAICC